MEREDEYRKVAWDVIAFIENIILDDGLCDCDYEEGKEGERVCHDEDCTHILIWKDLETFEKRLHAINKH